MTAKHVNCRLLLPFPVVYNIHVNFKLVEALFGHYVSTFYTTCLAKDH